MASLAGEMALRKATAARLAERVLNELVVTRQWQNTSPSGTITDGNQEYRWQMRLETWNPGTLRLLTVQVIFPVQGQDHDVQLSTLVDTSVL